jgi:ribosomal protein L40E
MPQQAEEMNDDQEKALCTSCMASNEPSAHFCAKCGAPLTPYAATGPFESILAEGHVYRQAVEKPRNLVVVLGMWLIFGMIALGAVVMLFVGRDVGFEYLIAGAFLLPVSLIMIWKTTRNYLARRPKEERHGS